MSYSFDESGLSGSIDVDAARRAGPPARGPAAQAKFLDPSMDSMDSLGDVLSIRDGVPSRPKPAAAPYPPSSPDSSPSPYARPAGGIPPTRGAAAVGRPGARAEDSDDYSDSFDDSPPVRRPQGIPPVRSPLSSTTASPGPDDSPSPARGPVGGARSFGLDSEDDSLAHSGPFPTPRTAASAGYARDSPRTSNPGAALPTRAVEQPVPRTSGPGITLDASPRTSGAGVLLDATRMSGPGSASPPPYMEGPRHTPPPRTSGPGIPPPPAALSSAGPQQLGLYEEGRGQGLASAPRTVVLPPGLQPPPAAQHPTTLTAYGVAAETAGAPRTDRMVGPPQGGLPTALPTGQQYGFEAESALARGSAPVGAGRQASPVLARPSGEVQDRMSPAPRTQVPADWSDDDGWNGELSLGDGAGAWNQAHSPSRSGGGGRTGRRSPNIRLSADTMQGRLEAAVQESLKRHVSTWDKQDVCNWVEVIGFPQYRRKFSHNGIDGALLLKLDDDKLRKALGILPLGHREALMARVNELRELVKEVGEDASTRAQGKQPVIDAREFPRNPASASPNVIPPEPHLGPAQGKITVKEQRNKLLYELDRTVNKSAQAGTLLDQIKRTKELTDDEAKRLRGQLVAVEKEHKLLERRAPAIVDPDAAVPWKPNNAWTSEIHPERIARPGEDPNLDLTFSPRVTKVKDVPKDSDYATIRMAVESAYRDPSIALRIERDLQERARLKEAVEDARRAAAEGEQMDSLNKDAEAMAKTKRGRKTEGFIGYWVPGGLGYNHAKPKVMEQDSAPDKEALRISEDIKFLEKKFKAWQYEGELAPPSTERIRRPYAGLLEAIDELIEAVLTPKDEVFGAFRTAVKSYFRESNFDLEGRKAKGGDGGPPDPFLTRIARIKGMDRLTDLDKAAMRQKERAARPLGAPPARSGKGASAVADVEKRLRETKIKAAAGLIHMAEFVAHAYGRKKEEDPGSESEEDEEAKRKKERARLKKKGLKIDWTAHGPFVPNGVLERNLHSAKAWDVLSKRMGKYRTKVGLGAVTIDAAKQRDDMARSSALEKEAAKADQFFQLLGWHHAQPAHAEHGQPQEDMTGELINRLLRRALFVAELRDRQVEMVKEAKASKLEYLKKLTLQQSRLAPSDPKAKEVQREISRVKALEVDTEPLPEVDWNAEQWREDGLQDLQNEELSLRRQELTRRWEKERVRKMRSEAKRAQRVQHMSEVLATDWTRADQPSWDVDDVVMQHDHLTYFVRLLGQAPSSELRKFLRMPPSGLQDTGGRERGGPRGQDREAAAGMVLEKYDGGDDAGGGGRGRETEEERARRLRMEASKALKYKKIRVFRALTTMKFVEFTDQKIVERDRKLKETLSRLDEERDGKKRMISAQEKDGFFQRLLDDIDRRRLAMEERVTHALQEQMAAMAPFRARPYSPGRGQGSGTVSPGHPGRRVMSPRPGSASPSAYASRATSPGQSSPGVEAARRPQSAGGNPRQGGGFAYWYATGAPAAPRTPRRSDRTTGAAVGGHGAGPHPRARPLSAGPGQRSKQGSPGRSVSPRPEASTGSVPTAGASGQVSPRGQQQQYGRYRVPRPATAGYTGYVGPRGHGTWARAGAAPPPGVEPERPTGQRAQRAPAGGRGQGPGGSGARRTGGVATRHGQVGVADELQQQMAAHQARYVQARAAGQVGGRTARAGLLGATDSEASLTPPDRSPRGVSPSPSPGASPQPQASYASMPPSPTTQASVSSVGSASPSYPASAAPGAAYPSSSAGGAPT